MQLGMDIQIVTCRGGSVSRKVCNRLLDVVKLGRRGNAVRGPGMSRSTGAWRKTAYPNRLGSRVSGRLTSQRARHAPAKGNAGSCFSLCRSASKSRFLSQLYVRSFSSHKVRAKRAGRRVRSCWLGTCLAPGVPQRKVLCFGPRVRI